MASLSTALEQRETLAPAAFGQVLESILAELSLLKSAKNLASLESATIFEILDVAAPLVEAAVALQAREY
jgi:hypothetical protein